MCRTSVRARVRARATATARAGARARARFRGGGGSRRKDGKSERAGKSVRVCEGEREK